MRRLRVVVLLAAVAVGLAPALPAQAGNWAVTLLDPLPDRVEADKAYTVGYWVLQHGSHPFDGDLGRTGLRLVGPERELEFEGTALPEAAHYAVAIAVPAGRWRVYAVQGLFEPFDVGTLTVPGGLKLKPSETAVNVRRDNDAGEAPYWGAVHPPGLSDRYGGEVQSVREQPAAAAQPTAARPEDAAPQPRTAVVVGLLTAGAVVALLASGVVGPLRRRLRR